MLQSLNGKHGTHVTGIDAEGLDFLLGYAWPGNVRELRNVMERAAIVRGVGLIQLTDLRSPVSGVEFRRNATESLASKPSMVVPLGQPLIKLEEDYIKTTLEHVGGNRKLAAQMLGISLRTLQNRILAIRHAAEATTPGA
jgi:transcriptional regulator with PAS, ATPase and Fis domain